ncbi:hypothetical protein SAMN04488515_2752 [Cognatiyoonia koreensis]|uniref:Uncharacterized protein n=1 Tax=Cognatiyoonia koreensis TaxID=364200 RepID=A0A1I0RJF2_9RHOB|nr:nicotinate phosphoribosyltransferase [Cognatiyoonia koreensis]SEW40886.1 hypothetical protein SAMN04488515_2752 [Cognatiyoonia koreensis]
MNDTQKSPNRKWLYALIPAGFAIIVLIMLGSGEVVQETTDSVLPDELEEATE